MAENAAKEYRDIHFDICYCSPMRRARETAEIVLKGRHVPIIIDDRLIEMGFGIYEGVENTFQIPDCPINELFYRPEEYTTPVENGESLGELYARTGGFLSGIVEPALDQGKDVLVVGHGTMNLSIICQMRHLPIEKFWSAGVDNCKLMQV